MMHPRQGRYCFLILLLFSGFLAACQPQADDLGLQTRVAQAVETLVAAVTQTATLLPPQPTPQPTPVLVEVSADSTPLPTASLEPIPPESPSSTAEPTEAPPPILETEQPAATATDAAPIGGEIIPLGVPGGYVARGSHARITDLQVWQGRIYIAHGDWTLNTGPVRAVAYNPAAGSFLWDEQYTFNEEEIEVFRVYEAALLAPGGDGREDWSFGSLYVKSPGAGWSQLRRLPGGVHVWDTAISGSLWVAVGSGDGGEGRIWISNDGGSTWALDPAGQTLLGINADDPLQTHAGLFRLGGQIHLAGPNGCFVYLSPDWQPAPGCDLAGLPVFKSAEWNGIVALVPYAARPVDAAGKLFLYDGISTRTLDFGQPVLDAVEYNGRLLVLTAPAAGKAQIFSLTSPEGEFNLLAALDLPPLNPLKPYAAWPTALEALDGSLYLGLQDGQLIRFILQE